MSLARVVVDNSAMVPAYFREPASDRYDAGLVTARSRSLVQAIRVGRVKAFVPSVFYREFLNVAVATLDARGSRTQTNLDYVRGQFADLLSLPLITVDMAALAHDAAELALAERCPAADSWYLAAARLADAALWISHPHRDEFSSVAAKFVSVRLLSRDSPSY